MGAGLDGIGLEGANQPKLARNLRRTGQFFFKFGYSISYKFVDRGIFEVLGPSGISSVVLQVASNLHKLQSGYLYHYAFSILVGASLLFTIRGLWLFFGYYIDYRIFILFFVILFFLSNFKKD